MAPDQDSRHEDTYVGQLPRPPRPKGPTAEFPPSGVAHVIVFRADPGGELGRGQSHAISDKTIIGRGDDADITLLAHDVSRRHAQISATAGMEFMLRDLDSANGTLVNDRQVKEVVLKPGDEMKIGASFTLLFTRYHPMETQLIQSQKLESLGMLAAGIAHEINNPLAFVYYSLESLTQAMSKVGTTMVDILSAMLVLRDRLGPLVESTGLDVALGAVEQAVDPEIQEEVAECLGDAKNGVQRIVSIVRDLRDFSRLEEDRVAAVNLTDVMETALKIAHNEIKHRARLVKDYCEAPMTMANEGRLAQVFLNLLTNATQAIDRGRSKDNTITVRTRIDKDHAIAEVQDTGVGIAQEHLRRVFEPFFTRNESNLGSGLGLSICHSIVASHGGTIEVTSTQGEGACFAIRLPRLEADVVARATSELEPVKLRDPLAEAHILVVDDEAVMRKAIKRALRDHRVEVAGSATEAEQLLLNDQSFDLVLCDLLMPTGTGMDLYRWIDQRYPELLDRIVFMSGGSFTPTAREFARTVPNRVLDKPVGLETLQAVIGEMVDRGKRSDS